MSNNKTLYPLKFQPIYKYRIWGGNKLQTELNKVYSGKNIGESWELSDVQGNETKVSNGNLAGYTLKQLTRDFREDFCGNQVCKKFGEEFPLLIKFIDAKTPLSIQVHPHDTIAKKRHNSFGKNEMWYVMAANENAEIIVGFNQQLDKNSYKKLLKQDTILDVLNSEPVYPGDVFYIPTGRVHAIGAGVLLAEIQQTSDITYRIFDYNRVDKSTGKTRELHNDLAIDVIDFNVYNQYKTNYQKKENKSSEIIDTPYFTSNIVALTKPISVDYTQLDSFVIHICTQGSYSILFNEQTYKVSKGETILLPASLGEINITPNKNSEILEVHM